MSEDEGIEGLEPGSLFRAALGGEPGDPEAAARAAAEEERVRAEIEERLPDLELLELLGRGGMGYVYRARQKRLEREVALKVLAPEGERSSGFAERFEREAQALARLNHPGIVAVYDYGQEESFCWLLMEYVEGSNLRDVIRAGKLEPAEALALVPKVCEALQFAHDQGVVHRDVKPENLLLDASGAVKIADFGLAKLIGTPTALVALTGSQQVLGTFRYMAPEQLDRPLEVDHRADIYSLGVVFYEMLTGEIPMGRFDPPSLHSAASLGVDDVVLRALEKEPARRYQRAAEVKSDLDSLERGRRAPQAAAPRASARGDAPRVSWLAVTSAALFGVYVFPFLVTTTAVLARSGQERVVVIGQSLSLRSIVTSVLGLVGLALMVTGSAVGFRALDRIRRGWPRFYGAGAAVVGAWGGILLGANAALLFPFFNLRAVPGSILPLTSVVAPLVLVACDAGFLFWYRRRFLRRCRAESSVSARTA